MEPSYRRSRFLPTEYTSFRPDIINFFLEQILPNSKRILDPMAGTAPLIPYIGILNKQAIFNDINPLHYFVNRAKTRQCYNSLNTCFKGKMEALFKEVYYCLRKLRGKRLEISDKWIPDNILDGLMFAWETSDTYDEQISHFIKAIVLLTVRPFSSISKSEKNSTWFKPGGMTTYKDPKDIIKSLISIYTNYFGYYYSISTNNIGKIDFSIGDASSITVDNAVDSIITSPPYPNRYDFTTAFCPELYFLNKVGVSPIIDELKKNMLASNSVKNFTSSTSEIANSQELPRSVLGYLAAVKRKGKPKENNYYHRYFLKYYSSLFRIIEKLATLLSPDGSLYIVVQNNVHRGELNTIDKFVKEYLINKGFHVKKRYQTPVSHQGKRNISATHPVVIQKHFETIIQASR